MEPTQQDDILTAVTGYFNSIGCSVGLGRMNTNRAVRLPNSATVWNFLIEDEYLIVKAVVIRPWDATDRQQKLFKIALSDPDSFPKILAHMEKHSKFLRGGTNHTRFVPKAV